MEVKVKCIVTYEDMVLTKEKGSRILIEKGTERIVDKKRADELVNAGVCKIVEIIKEKIETAKLDINSEKAVKKTITKKKAKK